MVQILDVQKLRLLQQPSDVEIQHVFDCDLLVAGGGMGGCAAALAACRAGRSVVLTEETDWLGGQMTSQGVSALDEHAFIETAGGTRAYHELRELIRAFYREHATLTAAAREAPALNPGNGWVSRLCFEPAAGLWALDQLLGPYREQGHLTLLLRRKAVSVQVEDDRVKRVVLRHLDGDEHVEVRPRFVLDATELGDLLPLSGAEYRIGAESASETGEPSARPGPAAPECVQSLTYPFALELRPGERHYVRKPASYELHRERQPYTLAHHYPDRGWVSYGMFDQREGTPGSFWAYRRLIDRGNFDDPRYAHDLAMINWPGNDYRHGGIVDVEPEAALRSLQEAKELSLGFCHWLQTECPRGEGAGYPELLLRPDVMGTGDGLAKYPYVRESRRIVPMRRVVEQDIAASHQPGARARSFPDSVGIGFYPIDIHPAEGEARIPPEATRPFQIPLSALVPVRLRNLLPACKNIGTTHITNGAYRLHPVEWAIGEAAAQVAVFCLDRSLDPRTVAEDPHRLRRLQRKLVRSGIPLHWYVDVPVDHPAFEPAQILAAWGVWTGDPQSLEFGPSEVPASRDLNALTAAPVWAREPLERMVAFWLPRWRSLDRQTLARSVYEALSV